MTANASRDVAAMRRQEAIDRWAAELEEFYQRGRAAGVAEERQPWDVARRRLGELHKPHVRRQGWPPVCEYDNRRWPCPEVRMLAGTPADLLDGGGQDTP